MAVSAGTGLGHDDGRAASRDPDTESDQFVRAIRERGGEVE